MFQAMSPALGTSIFQTLRDEHKDVYKSTLISLAQQKRLRPVFIQRNPAPKQIEWMLATSRLKAADSVSEHVLQIWLLRAKQEMLTQFLDELGVEHDENGTVEDLPETLDAKKLQSAVDLLLNQQPREEVALYLNMFQLQRPDGWPEVRSLLDDDDRLYLGEEPPAQEASESIQSPEAKSEPVAEAESEPVAEAKSEPVAEAESGPVAEAKSEPVAEAESEPVPEAKSEPVPEAKNEPVPEAKGEPEPSAKKEVS